MTADDVTQAIRQAVAGAGGISCFRNPACGHRHLDLRPLNALRFYHPGDLTVGAEAGMTVAELNRILAAQGQWLPLDVPHPEVVTLGAVLATRSSGPLRHGYGTVRDFTIGLEMATAAGALVHSGGRVVKNVAGYDWMKLAIGARGGLGIITAVHFKVFPRPQSGLTAIFSGLDWDQVAALRLAMLRSPLHPVALELLVTSGGERRVLLRAAGSATVLRRYQSEASALAQAARCEVKVISDAVREAALWDGIANFPRAGDDYRCWPAAEAIAILSALPETVAISGRLGLGAYWIRGARPASIATPAIDPGAAALAARIKQALDPEGRLHGDACA